MNEEKIINQLTDIPCPKCGNAKVLCAKVFSKPLPASDTMSTSICIECFSCGAHTRAVETRDADSFQAAFITAAALWNEGKVTNENQDSIH